MTQSFPRLGVVMLAFALSAQLFAQTTSYPKQKRRKPAAAAPVASQADLQSLRDLVVAQQKQIETQSQQVQQLQEQLHQVLDAVQQSNANTQKLQSGADQAQAAAAQAQQSASQAQQTAAEADSEAKTAASATPLLQTQS